MRKADLIGGIGFAIFALLMILIIIPSETEDGTTYGLSPYFYPTAMSVGILVCALGLIWQNWRAPVLHDSADNRDKDNPQHGEQTVSEAASETAFEEVPQEAPITLWRLTMFLLAMALIVAGVWLINAYGIVIFGPLLIAALMIFLGERNWRIILPTMTIPVAIVYLIVTYVLRSPLP